jgi:YidC/Oxa1 family membrane protein insertase
MNFDRNTVIGFIMLAVLFFAMFYFNNQEQAAQLREKARLDSQAKANKPVIRDTTANKPFVLDTGGSPVQAPPVSESLSFLENDLLKIAFTNKGAQPKWVELKKFKAPDSTTARLSSTAFDRISYVIKNGTSTAESSDQYFTGGTVSKNPDGSQTITYQLQRANGASLVHQFVMKPGNYMVDFNLQATNASQLFDNNTMNLTWRNEAKQLQKDLSYEREQSRICFNEDGDYDYFNIASRDAIEFEDPVKWVGVKQQFFNTTLVAKNRNFSSGRVDWTTPDTASGTLVRSTASLKMPLEATPNVSVPLGIFYGPTDYKILKNYGNEMENMVDLGSGVFAFVKYINRWIILPVFDLFAKITTNFGIVILLLTLFIRLLISPLTYSSYLSGAKMKALRPEIEQLKAKYGTDQQQMSMEQMRLFREAGVNPLGGCIPALLQIPIFFALYSFFNSNVALRGQGFLWADDLSVYDSILDFGDIPLISSIYGSHVSLFTITAVITSFLISLYSMSMTPDQNNPVLKYMPYFFPIILLFVFNRLPAGLTWYYTVSNLITLGLQFVIQNYIINHDKVLAKIDANRKKPKTKSKWQERMEQMQEQQKKMKDMQNRR